MTAGELIAACLGGLGVTRTFGRGLPGLGHVPVADDDLAALLADADGRRNRMGAALLSSGVLRLSSQPGAEVEPVPVDRVADLPEALVFSGGQELPGAHAVQLDLDLADPVPDGVQPATQEVTLERIRLSPDLGTEGIVILAGPGVVREDAAADLLAFASATGWPVVTTFGAVGAVPAGHPLHHGVAGLQERDFALAGVTDALFVIVVGVDTAEVPAGGVGTAQQLTLHPRHLMGAADGWPDPGLPPPPPRLVTELEPVVAHHPARGLAPGPVVADPGPAGLWVARGYPATTPDQVLVPATVAPGFAAATALVDGLDGKAVTAVTTDPVDPVTTAVVEVASQLEVPVTLQAWEPDVDATRALIELAGPVSAWLDPLQ